MSMNAANVAILKPLADGVLYWAPVGTKEPNDATTPLPAAWRNVGYIAEDGIVRSAGLEAGEGKVAFGGDTVVQGVNKRSPNVKFTIIETSNADAMAMVVHTNDITKNADGTLNWSDSGRDPEPKTLVFESVRDDLTVERTVYGHTVAGEMEDVTNDNDTVYGYGVTYNARKVNGAYSRTYQAKIVAPTP